MSFNHPTDQPQEDSEAESNGFPVRVPPQVYRQIKAIAERENCFLWQAISIALQHYNDKASIPYNVETPALLMEIRALEAILGKLIESNLAVAESSTLLENNALQAMILIARETPSILAMSDSTHVSSQGEGSQNG